MHSAALGAAYPLLLFPAERARAWRRKYVFEQMKQNYMKYGIKTFWRDAGPFSST